MKFIYFLVSVLLSFYVYGSTFVYMELSDITERSDAIVRGTVKDTESVYNEERTKIFTYSVIDVKETFKGKVPPVVRVRTFGGRVGDINMKVPGMPEFKKGEEVFLFLRKNEDFWHVTGMIQGKYTVDKDESGKEFLKNDFKNVIFKKVNSDNKLEDMRPEEIKDRFDYSEFVSKIKSMVSKKNKTETKNISQ
ncbi:MAG: hypothetical protein N3B13_01305 [Deltaproteobacteria bacterium]|nr:hypothetical protein [Deltaproteobacteria bacterium]